jgi:tape measure domain-containing protein
MANYTALVDVKVDLGRTNKAFKNIEGSLLRVSKATKGTNKFLGQMEKTFGGIQKSMLISAQAGRSTVRQLKQLSGASKTSAADVEKLKKQVKTLQTELTKLQGKTSKIGPIFARLNKIYKENAYLIQSMTTAFFGFIQYQLIGGLKRMTDQFVLMSNRVRVVNQDMNVFNTNMRNAFTIAQETRQPLFTVANTLARIGRNSAKLRTDFTRLARITSTIGKSFQIAGATIEEANNAMIQLSQAFASGRLQGDELRSVLELAPRLAQAISSSIGITVGQMRQFAKEGKLTTKVLEAAIVEASDAVDKEFKSIQKTIGQAMTQVNNSLTMAVGSIDKVTKTNKAFADAFTRISKAIDRAGKSTGGIKFAEMLRGIANNFELILIAGGSIVATGVLFAIAMGFKAIVVSLGPVSLGLAAVSAALTTLGFSYFNFGEIAKPVLENVTGSNAEQLAKLKQQVQDFTRFIDQENKKLAEGPGFLQRFLIQVGRSGMASGASLLDPGRANLKGSKPKDLTQAEKEREKILQRIADLEKRIAIQKANQAQSAMDLFLAEGQRAATIAQQLAAQSGIGAGLIRDQRRGRSRGGSDPTGLAKVTARQSSAQNIRGEIVRILEKQFSVNLPDNDKVKALLQGILGDDNTLKESAVKGLISQARGQFLTEQGYSRKEFAHLPKPGGAIPGMARSAVTAATAGEIQALQDRILSIQLDYEDSLLRSERSANAQTRNLQDRSAILGVQLNEKRAIYELDQAALIGSIALKQAEAEFLFLQKEGLTSVELLNPKQKIHLDFVKEEISAQEKITYQIRQQNKLLALRNQTRGAETELKVRKKFGDQLRASDPISSAFSTGIMNIAKEFGLSMDMLKIRTDALAGSQRDVIDINTESMDLKKIEDDVLKQILEKRKKLELDADIKKESYSFQEQAGGIIQSGVSGSGPAASRGMQAGQAAMAASAGGPMAMIGAGLLSMVMSNKKVQAAIEKLFEMIGEVFDALIDPLGDLLTDVFSGMKPIFGILKMVMKPLGKVFTSMMKVFDPLMSLIEQMQPLFFMFEAVMHGILALVDILLQFIGQGIRDILGALGMGSGTDVGYKSAALLSSEERILGEIEETIGKTADHLEKINDVIFDIEQSTLNLAAPAVKLEDAAAKYDELFEAATKTDASQEAIDAFTGYSKEFLQQSQDIFKSSAAYQDIYDQVLSDINSLNTEYMKSASDTLTEAFRDAIFDLDLVGSDLGEVFTNLVDDFNAGIISIADVQTFFQKKQEQIAYDLSLYDYEDTGITVKSIGDLEKMYKARLGQYDEQQGRASSSMEGKMFRKNPDGTTTSLRGYESELAAGSAGVDSGIYNRVLQAALLIMNPEHYAVSVRRNSDGSLEVLDRATDAGALSMMAAANAAGVPVVVDPATARALYAGKTSDLSNLNIGSSPTTVGTSAGSSGIQIGAVERVTFDREESKNPLEQLLEGLPDLGGSLSGLAQAILDGFMEALKALGAGVTEILNAVFGFIGDAFAGVGDVATMVISAIMGPIMDAMSSAGNIVSEFLAGIFGPIGEIIVGVPDFLAGLFYPISGVFVGVGDFLMGIFKPILDMGAVNITAFFQQLFDLIFTGGGLDLSSVGQQILGAALDFGGQAMNALQEIWNKTTEAITGFFNFGSSSFNAGADIIKRVGETITDVFNISVPSGGIKLLKNPFHSYNIGPEYFINWSWEKGGLLPEQFANGGNTKAGTAIHSSLMGSSGGMAVGKSHLSGGMPGVIRATGQPIEFEGGEYIINKRSVDMLGKSTLDLINNVRTPTQAHHVQSTYGNANRPPVLESAKLKELLPFVGKPIFRNGGMPESCSCHQKFGNGGMPTKNVDGEGYASASSTAAGTVDGDTPGFPKTLFQAGFSTRNWPWPFSQIGDHGIEAKFSMKNAADIGDSYFRAFANGGSLNFEQKLKHENTDSAINSLYYGKRLGAKATASKKGERSDFYDGRPDLPLVPFIGKGTETAGESCTSVTDYSNCREWGEICTPWGCVSDPTNCRRWGKIETCTPILRNYYHDVELWGEKLLPNNSSAKGMESAQESITGAFQLVLAAATGMHPYWPGAKSTKGYYAKGGMIHGASHSKGGVPIYAEGGEFVVNKNATRRHRGLLSRINSFQEGGSTSFNPSDYFGVRTTENTGDSGFLSSVYSGGPSETQLGQLNLTNSVTAQNTAVSAELLSSISETQAQNFNALSALIMGQSYNTSMQEQSNELLRNLMADLTNTIVQKFDTGWNIVQSGIDYLRQQVGRDGRANDRYYMNLSAQNGDNLQGIKQVQYSVGEGQEWTLAGMYNNTVYAPANYNKLIDIKETVDHMRQKVDKQGGGVISGVLGGIGGAIGGDIGGVITSVGNIFSDRGVKTFRGGGMTESQQTDMLRKVQPQTFRYKSGGPVQTGFMAQDLQRSSFGRQFVHDSPVGKYVDGGIIGPLLASQSIMQSRMDSYQMGGQIAADSGMSEALLQGIIDAIRDQDMNVNVYTNTEDEVGQMMSSSNSSSAEAGYRDVVNYA